MGDSGKKILICDDDDLLREFYARVLKTRGYEPLSATNGDEALTILEKEDGIALAIIDLLMPIRTGWEVIEFMKNDSRFKDIPIIAITGLATSFDEFERVKDVCNGVVHKGEFDLEKFNEIINDLL